AAAAVDLRRGAAPEARAGIEDELSAEMAHLARVLDRTRRDLEDVLTERLGPAGSRPGLDPQPAATGGRGAGVGGH
ncbi:MAG: hypothetical protein M0Z30_21985, partial [Actinomycetota bacterium]|nr:hypothetical protein [Actinomycetota bacterium]